MTVLVPSATVVTEAKPITVAVTHAERMMAGSTTSVWPPAVISESSEPSTVIAPRRPIESLPSSRSSTDLMFARFFARPGLPISRTCVAPVTVAATPSVLSALIATRTLELVWIVMRVS